MKLRKGYDYPQITKEMVIYSPEVTKVSFLTYIAYIYICIYIYIYIYAICQKTNLGYFWRIIYYLFGYLRIIISFP